MNKSRNNEYNMTSIRQSLIAIENNANILEKTKSLYVKKSVYSSKYKGYYVDQFNKRQKEISSTNKQNLSFNYNRPLTKSSATLHKKSRSIPSILSKVNFSIISNKPNTPNNIKLLTKPIKQKQKLNELFLSATLKNISNKDTIKGANNNKCLMYIEELVNKRKKDRDKDKTSISLLKEIDHEHKLFYFDQDLPLKYKHNSLFQINIEPPKREKSAHSSYIKIMCCDNLLNSISRRIDLYNNKNEFIREEDVVKKITEEDDNNSRVCINKTNTSNDNTNRKSDKSFINKVNSFILKDFEIDPQIQFSQSYFCSNYNNKTIQNKKHMQNRLIKKQLNRSNHSLNTIDQNIIQERKNIYLHQNKREIKERAVLNNNKDDINESSNNYMNKNDYLSSLSLKYMRNTLNPFFIDKITTKTSSRMKNNDDLNLDSFRISKSEYCSIIKENKMNDNEIQDTLRTLAKIQPKGLNKKNINKPNSVSLNHRKYKQKILDKKFRDNVERKYIKIHGKNNDLAIKGSLLKNQLIDLCMKILSDHKMNVINNSNIISLVNRTLKEPIIIKIKRNSISNTSISNKALIEEAQLQKEKDETKGKKLLEETIKEQQRKMTEQERIKVSKEEYQNFIKRKNEEEEEKMKLKQEETIKLIQETLVESKEKKIKNKLSFINLLEANNPEPQSSNILAIDPIPHSMILKKDVQLDVIQRNKNKRRSGNKIGRESFEKKYGKELVEEEIEVEKKEIDKKKIPLIKLRHDINYIIQESKNYEDKENDAGSFVELKQKLESLKNINEQAYVKYLENNFEEIQEEMANMKQIREEENMINSFIRNMDYSLSNTREKKKCLRSQFKILDPRCSYSASDLLQ